MFTWFKILTKVEKILVLFFVLVVLVTGARILDQFYDDYSVLNPVDGGLYVEGAVGKLEVIDPLYVQQGSVTHDISQLIFSGLTQYSPNTGEIIPDLATFSVSDNKREYTFVLKEGATWHDGIPVTSDDVIFTYNTVLGDPGFNGLALNYLDMTGIRVIKVDDRTVQFLLEVPDSFFLAKTLIGLLPEHLLVGVPVPEIPTSNFHELPIGSGPFRLSSIVPKGNYIEVNLEQNLNFYDPPPHITTLQIRIYQELDRLMSDQRSLDGIRTIPEEARQTILDSKRFNLIHYQLPQYVAVFINTESPKLKNELIRLALQLATDKAALGESIGESESLDTPLLEIDPSNWVFQHSFTKANGGLVDAGWTLPNKEALGIPDPTETFTVVDESGEAAIITAPNSGKDFRTTDEKLCLPE
ncbi:hypothetical protein IPJ72_04010 [Candidatus Peregrinibacteria bacterium]|nr:MAG: hypothetical protein IPJ72_04010 [Candidatus Peregrinibacteria bacterium]